VTESYSTQLSSAPLPITASTIYGREVSYILNIYFQDLLERKVTYSGKVSSRYDA
jgi:hypothetical protein